MVFLRCVFFRVIYSTYYLRYNYGRCVVFCVYNQRSVNSFVVIFQSLLCRLTGAAVNGGSMSPDFIYFPLRETLLLSLYVELVNWLVHSLYKFLLFIIRLRVMVNTWLNFALVVCVWRLFAIVKLLVFTYTHCLGIQQSAGFRPVEGLANL
jgi:hypothetical protein